MTTASLDAITLEVWWSRLVAIADEAATTADPAPERPGDDHLMTRNDRGSRSLNIPSQY